MLPRGGTAAFAVAFEVLAANGVGLMIGHDVGYTLTRVVSHAILDRGLVADALAR